MASEVPVESSPPRQPAPPAPSPLRKSSLAEAAMIACRYPLVVGCTGAPALFAISAFALSTSS